MAINKAGEINKDTSKEDKTFHSFLVFFHVNQSFNDSQVL